MAKALARKLIPLKNGTEELYAFLRSYRAEHNAESSTEKGHVYWSAPIGQWLLVMKTGSNAQVTFHAADDCPCKMI
jgi:sarcosine oxidase gamma subunit